MLVSFLVLQWSSVVMDDAATGVPACFGNNANCRSAAARPNCLTLPLLPLLALCVCVVVVVVLLLLLLLRLLITNVVVCLCVAADGVVVDF